MSRLIHRDLRQAPPAVACARGIMIRDAHGQTYIDASSGAAVSSLGHGHPEVIAAMQQQMARCAYAHPAFFTSDAAEELAQLLVATAPGDIAAAALVPGGAEAVEAALKLARQYFVEGGEPQRTVVIGRRASAHGDTLGALALGGDTRRAPFAPLLAPQPQVAPCYEYRGRAAHQSADEYTAALLDELETRIHKAGTDRVMAFCAEPVAGVAGGAIPPTPGYFKGVREICDRYGILFIADEVTCGMGRTGTTYAIEPEAVTPDIIVLGKGLAAGYQPLGAVLARGAIVERIRSGSGSFLHGHSCDAHPVAAAAALAVQQVIARDGLLEQVQKRGATLRRMLGSVFGQHPHVGDIRGRGLLLALELVQDRASREPFPAQRRLHAAVRAQALRRGLIVYPGVGCVDGVRGDHVLLAPPFIATASDLGEIVARLAEAVDAALKQ